MVKSKKIKGETTPIIPEKEDRDANLVAANENLNVLNVEEEEEEDVNSAEVEEDDILLNELEELVNAREQEMGEWTMEIEGFDMRQAALEAYVEKLGEDSLEDVKKRKKKGKAVKGRCTHWMTT
ncbi:hypothetical protein Bca101_043758 [Brassica carinata]